MQGWKLTKGKVYDQHPDEESLWKCFSFIFSSKSKKQSTYKYGFLRSILENLYSVDDKLHLKYDQLFLTFTRIYWKLVINHQLSQTDKSHSFSAVERIMYHIQHEHAIPSELDFDKLSTNIQIKVFAAIKKKAKRYVVGAVWGDTEGMLYSFSNTDEEIVLSETAYVFMQRYQQTLLKLNNYEWAKFLEKNNSVPLGFINAIDSLTKRNNLDYYRKILEESVRNSCFYCGKDMRSSKNEVDHFIPWSYIHNDNLWNLVLACRKCNNNKKDKIPERSYLTLLIERNNRFITNPDLGSEMNSYHLKNLKALYRYAENNGFYVGWTPQKLARDYNA